MRYLGIDYGTKKVGLALSDEVGSMAFPESVVPNTKDLLPAVARLVAERGVEAIVVGESRDYKGAENPVHAPANAFAQELGEKTGLPVSFEPEFMTSVQARSLQGDSGMIDASAAALVLQSFLDRTNKRSILDDDNET